MPINTPNLNLVKPLVTETYDVAVANANNDILDEAINDLDVAKIELPTLSKTTAIDADSVLLIDSAASDVVKKWTIANIKANLKTYFDTLYQALLVSGTNIKSVNGSSLLSSGDLSLATVLDLTVTLPSASWIGASAPFSKAVTLSGILATDKPFVDIEPSGTYATDVTMRENWNKVYDVDTTTNTLTFYADSVPNADIPLKVKVIR